MFLRFSVLFYWIPLVYASCVVVEYNCTAFESEYMLANGDDCSRFVHCSFGAVSYWQCRQGYIFDFCHQAPPEAIPLPETTSSTTTTTTTTTVRTAPVISPILPGILPAGPLPPTALSPYNPYLYGPGLGISSGGLGFNLNLNYNPLMGWGFNSNMALETPWSTMLAPLLGLPMFPQGVMPYGMGMPMGGFGGMGMGMPFGGMPGMYPSMQSPVRKRSEQMPTSRTRNAVRVNACVPTDSWPDSTAPITPSPAKINGSR